MNEIQKADLEELSRDFREEHAAFADDGFEDDAKQAKDLADAIDAALAEIDRQAKRIERLERTIRDVKAVLALTGEYSALRRGLDAVLEGRD